MTSNTKPNAPTHRLFVVRGRPTAARWLEIGVAWENRDGEGFSLSLDALPVGGHIVMRTIDREIEGGQP
jgi:hypothetical protein